MDLIEKIRAARRQSVEIEGHRYTLRRPTQLEMFEYQFFIKTGASVIDQYQYLVNRFVDGWDLKEIDLIPGGTPAEVPISVELLQEWLLDRPDVLLGLFDAVFKTWDDYVEQQKAAEKKSETGLNDSLLPESPSNP